ncbi:MAG TPA: hypothetical protein VHW96_24580 [Solirubrobacteraceae bacterium]|jgi:hypothetical protein|nr:hypothetical protein [Solirubrobacteraceae bacterium]
MTVPGAMAGLQKFSAAGTRLADRPDPVSDEVWAEAARHDDEVQT